jgi:hypothetical protein
LSRSLAIFLGLFLAISWHADAFAKRQDWSLYTRALASGQLHFQIWFSNLRGDELNYIKYLLDNKSYQGPKVPSTCPLKITITDAEYNHPKSNANSPLLKSKANGSLTFTIQWRVTNKDCVANLDAMLLPIQKQEEKGLIQLMLLDYPDGFVIRKPLNPPK